MPAHMTEQMQNQPRTEKGRVAREIVARMTPEHSREWFEREMDRVNLHVNESYFTELYKRIHGVPYRADEGARRLQMSQRAKVLAVGPLPGEPDPPVEEDDEDEEDVEVRRDRCDQLGDFMRLALCVQAVGGVRRARALIDEMERIHAVMEG